MTFHDSWTALNIVNAASGLLFIALGVFVGRVRTAAANRAFALFAITYGGAQVAWNLWTVGTLGFTPATLTEASAYVLAAVLFATAAVGLVRLALLFPTPVTRKDRSALVTIGTVCVVLWYVWTFNPVAPRLPAHPGEWFGVAWTTVTIALVGLPMLFAIRASRATDRDAYAYAIMASALALQPAFFAGVQQGLYLQNNWWGLTEDLWKFVVAALLGPVFAIAALWISTAARSTPARARQARMVAWIALGATLAGALASLSTTPQGDHWGFGVVRTAGVLILAYAILRAQLLGIDLKVQWTISKGTIAATFIAVFFVASETAQQFVGETLGSAYVGIAAAGMLVFAISPLQRIAEHLAQRAVPLADATATPPDTSAHPKALRVYEHAVRTAANDGAITPDEEEHLAHIAQELGIPHPQALRIRRAVERERDEPN